MGINKTVAVTTRLIREKHTDLIKLFNKLEKIISLDDKEAKIILVKSVLDNAHLLADNLASSDTPDWLHNLIHECQKLVNNQNNTNVRAEFLKKMYLIKPMLLTHSWDFTRPEGEVFPNVDNIFEQCKKESDIEELFNELVKSLEEIIASDLIDSRKMLQDIERLIDIINGSKKASYLMMFSNWELFKRLCKNISWEYLDSDSIIGPLFRGFRKTANQVNIKFGELDKSFQEQTQEKLEIDFQYLIYDGREFEGVLKYLPEENENSKKVDENEINAEYEVVKESVNTDGKKVSE